MQTTLITQILNPTAAGQSHSGRGTKRQSAGIKGKSALVFIIFFCFIIVIIIFYVIMFFINIIRIFIIIIA